MDEPQQNESALSQLQTKAHAELLDAVDRLRLDGSGCGLRLPQLIVCGDQSSGKSSVLEAISRVRFPANEILGTRFPCELVLRKAPTPSFSVTIVPANYRSEDERARLTGFEPPDDTTDLEHFPKVIEAASKYISEFDKARRFYEDRLRAEISGPDMPQLTLVDLPGLIHSRSGEQTETDLKTPEKIVKSYMADGSSVILAVVTADQQFWNQAVIELARSADPGGCRTLGIITMPDRTDAGSELEAEGIRWAQNAEMPLALGWHVLKNLSTNTRNASACDRDSLEKAFFSDPNRHSWNVLPVEDVGASALREKLSNILLDSIRTGLPTLAVEIMNRIYDCNVALDRLGDPKDSEVERRHQLSEISYILHILTSAALRSDYDVVVPGESNDPFFHHERPDIVQTRRLRKQLQDILDAFSSDMRDNGQYYKISTEANDTAPVDFSSGLANPWNVHRPVLVSMADMLEGISAHIKAYHGPGPRDLVRPEVANRIFHKQCSGWEAIARLFSDKCYDAVYGFFKEALFACAPDHIAAKIWERIALPHFEVRLEALERTLRGLLKPFKSGPLITVNYAALQEAQNKELALRTETPQDVRDRIHSKTEAVYLSVAGHYGVAMHTFVDNVATLAIEHCLVDSLRELFTPMSIHGLDVDVVRDLTMESLSVRKDREVNKERLKTLTEVHQICKRHSISAEATRPANEFDCDSRSGSDPPSEKTNDQIQPEQIYVANESTPTRGPSKPNNTAQLGFQGYLSPPKTPQTVS